MTASSIRSFAIVTVSLLLFNVNVFGQENFVVGQVITQEGETIDGFIDYRNWSRNPDEIVFKQTQSGPKVTYTPEEIREFSVTEQKYISRFVTIDETPFKVPQVQEIPRSNKQGTVFLKVLEEGDLSLYKYRGLRNNFYVERSGEITELISHEYVPLIRGRYILVDEDSDKYLRQLDEVAPDCSEISKRRLDYDEVDLLAFVMNCNRLINNETSYADPDFYTAESNQIRIRPYLALRRGNAEYTESIAFDEKGEASFSGYQLGADINIFLRGDLNTRAIILGLGYSNYSLRDESESVFEDFTSVNFRIGYLMLLGDNKKQPYISASLIPEARSSSYYNIMDAESFIMGFNVEVGVSISIIQAGIRADFGNKRTQEIKQQGISVVLGTSF